MRNNQVNAATAGGIFVKPTVTGSALVTIDNVRLLNNQFGMRIEGGTRATVVDSVATGNITNGFIAVGTAVGAAVLNVESSSSSHNGTNGVRADQAGAIIRISDTQIKDNLGNGLSINGGGAIVSFGNNSVDGNGVNGSPTSTLPQI